MTWSTYARDGVRSAVSATESARFGCSVARVDIGKATVELIAKSIAALDADVLVVRFDARRRDIPALLASSGRTVLPAGTLTYWERAVGPETEPPYVTNDDVDVLPIDELGVAGRHVVESIVRDTFASYPNHYAANPLFDATRAAAGYVEWALSRLADDTGHVLVLRRGGEPIGLATLADVGGELEIELAGLVPQAQGRGDYGSLIAGCVHTAALAGRDRVVISTQVDNVRVQRAWIKAGFKPFAAVETVHLIAAERWEF